MYYEDVLKLTNQELINVMRGSAPGPDAFELCSRELDRRYLLQVESAVNRVDASSRRLERLTRWLIGLTIALAALAAPPAIEVVTKFLSN